MGNQKCVDVTGADMNLPEQKKCALLPCTKDCTVTHRTAWDTCKGGCNGKTQRFRTKQLDRVGYGKQCPPLLDEQSCSDDACLILRAQVAANASRLAAGNATAGQVLVATDGNAASSAAL